MKIDQLIALCAEGLKCTAEYRQDPKTFKRRMVPLPGRISRTPAIFRAIRQVILQLDEPLLQLRRVQWCLDLVATQRQRGKCKRRPSYTALTHALGGLQHLLMQERTHLAEIAKERKENARFWDAAYAA